MNKLIFKLKAENLEKDLFYSLHKLIYSLSYLSNENNKVENLLLITLKYFRVFWTGNKNTLNFEEKEILSSLILQLDLLVLKGLIKKADVDFITEADTENLLAFSLNNDSKANHRNIIKMLLNNKEFKFEELSLTNLSYSDFVIYNHNSVTKI